jgi:hypothetical protein
MPDNIECPDQLPERRFEFIPLWGFFVFLGPLVSMRRP